MLYDKIKNIAEQKNISIYIRSLPYSLQQKASNS